ncbi:MULTISPECIES: O-antigen ligase family protein [Tessaracoccus]|uniref:O-antigen ligase family protein n=1 Tax=Tessaracoccus TaxID=72763 RepID=UPI0009C3525B|nr:MULTISPECIES: O-antigen ligase family protein [Tessaracoccus]AQX16741.1 hypothetical protein BKM78_13100 [Tessaracoccus sp. T2.5-30]
MALLIPVGVLLNQSDVVFGINLSLADPVALLLLLTATLFSNLKVPHRPLVFFLLVSTVTLSVSLWLVPLWVTSGASLQTVLRDYAKACASFGFFVIGVNLVRVGRTWALMRAFVVAAVAVGAIGMLSLLLPAVRTLEVFFFGGFRFRGLINDPNYYSALAVTALALLWRDPRARSWHRMVGTLSLIGATLATGSKTGAMVLAVWISWRLLGDSRSPADAPASFGGRRLLTVAGLVITTALVLSFANPDRSGKLAAAVASIPALNRIAPLLTNFGSAIAQDGSSRDAVWGNAMSLIEMSPIAGVGMGTYLEVSRAANGVPLLAHNTVLQLAAEWGLPLAALFFIWAAGLLFRRPGPGSRATWLAGRDALLVLLVASTGVSLNNARTFWLLLGVTWASLISGGQGKPTGR